MKKGQWKQWALAFCSGCILLQTTGCTEAAVGLTALASVVTAGGVIYLVQKVID